MIIMKNFWEWMALVIYLAIIFTLVRPKSQGPALVKNTGDALTGLVKAGTGGGTF
jgi:hypothetical protein